MIRRAMPLTGPRSVGPTTVVVRVLGRTGEPRERGDVAAFPASDRARFVTGITVPVDGGLLKSI